MPAAAAPTVGEPADMSTVRAVTFLLLMLTGGSASAETLTVTNGSDARRGSIPGSLRAVLESASAGDEIVFDDQVDVVRLERGLDVPAELDDLTIRGPVRLEVGRRRAASIEVAAHGVVLQELTLVDVDVLNLPDRVTGGAQGSAPGGRGLRIRECDFDGAQLILDRVGDVAVEGTRFRGRARLRRPSVDLLLTDEVTLVGCTFDERTTLVDDSSTDFALLDSAFREATVRLAPNSGEIRGNTFELTEPQVVPGDFLPGRGALRIDDNEAPALRVVRTDCIITGNRLAGDSPRRTSRVARLSVQVFEPRLGGAGGPERGGPVTVRGNDVEAGLLGLLVFQAKDRTADVEVSGNTVTDTAASGLRLLARSSGASATDNRLVRCGGRVRARRFAAFECVAAGGVELELVGNEIIAPGDAGLRLDGPGILRTRDNSIADATGAGIVTGRRAGVWFSELDTVTSPDADGIDVAARWRAEIDQATVTDGAAAGIRFGRRTAGEVTRARLTGHAAAGVLLEPKAIVLVDPTGLADNGGPDVDLWPRGETSNSRPRKANRGLARPERLEIDTSLRRLTGTAPAGTTVSVLRRAPTGIELLGTTDASQAGTFSFPSSGTLACPAGTVLLAYASTPDSTSEPSPEIVCELPVDDVIEASRHTDGSDGDRDSTLYRLRSTERTGLPRVISADGRHVVFVSTARTLVTGDTNGRADVFLHDTLTRTTTRLSTLADGGEATSLPDFGLGYGGVGDRASISANGRFVVFCSDAPDLDQTGSLLPAFAYRLDRDTGALRGIARLANPGLVNASLGPRVRDLAVADDGTVFLVMASDAYVEADDNGHLDVLSWKDGAFSLVSTGGTWESAPPNADATSNVSCTPDGSVIAFVSALEGLDPRLPDEGDHAERVYAGAPGSFELVSVLPDGSFATATQYSLADDGRFVAFVAVPDVSDPAGVFVFDRTSGASTKVPLVEATDEPLPEPVRVSVASGGRRLVVETRTSDPNRFEAWFVDRDDGPAVPIARGPGAPEEGDSMFAQITGDGLRIVLVSAIEDLVADDFDFRDDVFVLPAPEPVD